MQRLFILLILSLCGDQLLFARETSKVLIVDCGSQYTQLITRRIRELNIYSRVKSADVTAEEIQEFHPSAVILSGGPASVFDEDAIHLSNEVIEYCLQNRIPLFGICYGMQYLIHNLGGKVIPAEVREYGRTSIQLQGESELFGFLDQIKQLNVWMSHGDEVQILPNDFSIAAMSENGNIVAVENAKKRIYLTQFHPEVSHTEHGMEILKHFLVEIAQIEPNWLMDEIAEMEINKIQNMVAEDEHVICAISGGVDSCVASTLVHKAIGDRLHCVFVDNGLLRYKERERLKEMFENTLHLPVTIVEAQDEFLQALAGVTDPEEKRKRIGKTFIDVFDKFASALQEKLGKKPKFLVQGTLYPDVIESTGKFSQVIKSHHNVGGLPKDLQFTLIEPLRDLFKDEVRRLGKELGAPESFINRHPFPGPGLAIRILGEVTPSKVETLQLADEIFVQSLKEGELYDKIWQAGAILLPIRSVGVRGDARGYDSVIALRAVTSVDGMTADWFPFEHAFLAKVSNAIINRVPDIGRVVYDVSSKPPATIEWE